VHRYDLVPSEDVRPGTEIAVTLFDANRKPLDHPTILVAQ
jgi:hypothetical protein